jgi:hemolysin activation/secretion protein
LTAPASAIETNDLRDILQPERTRPQRERTIPATPSAPDVERAVTAEPGTTGFTLRAVVLEGATAVDSDLLRAVYQDLFDQELTIGDVERIVGAMTRIYRDRGFFLSRAIAPPQDLEAGVLRIRIIEGHVTDVAFEGTATADDDFAGYVEPILRDRPLRLERVERAILLISDLGGIRIRPRLEADDEDEGRYRLVLAIDRPAVDGLVALDNSGSPGAGPLQGYLALGANAVVGLNERLQLWHATVPNEPKELRAVGGEYIQPIGSDGLALAVSASASRVHRDRDRDGWRSDSKGRFFGLRAQYPLIRGMRENLWVSTTFDAYRLQQSEDGWLTSSEQIGALRTRVRYSIGDGSGRETALAAEVSQGLPFLGASHENPNQDPELEGNTQFSKLTLNLAHDQPLTADVALRIEASGQKAFDRQPYAEEFGLGGGPYLRGYDFSEVAGDDGIAGSVEVRYIRTDDESWLERLEPFAFFGFGKVWEEDRGGRRMDRALASTGIGVRAHLAPGVRAEIAVAERLPALGQSRTDGGPHVLFSLQKSF